MISVRGMFHTLVGATVLAAAMAASGCFPDAGCPCGADSSDPVSEHDLGFDGRHIVDDECVCQCGDDAPYGEPVVQECSDYEEACVDRNGTTQMLQCS